jgi:hypothetical protein
MIQWKWCSIPTLLGTKPIPEAMKTWKGINLVGTPQFKDTYKQRCTPEQQSGTASILPQGAGRTKKQVRDEESAKHALNRNKKPVTRFI